MRNSAQEVWFLVVTLSCFRVSCPWKMYQWFVYLYNACVNVCVGVWVGMCLWKEWGDTIHDPTHNVVMLLTEKGPWFQNSTLLNSPSYKSCSYQTIPSRWTSAASAKREWERSLWGHLDGLYQTNINWRNNKQFNGTLAALLTYCHTPPPHFKLWAGLKITVGTKGNSRQCPCQLPWCPWYWPHFFPPRPDGGK